MTPGEIKAWRKQHGDLTQRQFAEVLGVPLGTLRDWEQGSHRPPGNLLLLALSALDRMIAPPGMPMPPEAD